MFIQMRLFSLAEGTLWKTALAVRTIPVYDKCASVASILRTNIFGTIPIFSNQILHIVLYINVVLYKSMEYSGIT